MKKRVLMSCLAFSLLSAVAVQAAICTIIREKPDGTRIEMTVEGDTCTVDYNTSTCSCT